MPLRTEPYLHQKDRWPQQGRVILAQYDTDSIVVYQAYRPAIGNFAAQHGYFGGEFKLSRMTWIKPNFLWMMYRSGWGAKPGQEVVLAIRLQRSAFDSILAQAVHSSFQSGLYDSQESWQKAVQTSDVRLQWDPDHNPAGHKLERRAIQLGLRGDAIRKYAQEWILDIEDISDFVADQRQHVVSGNYEALLTPAEAPYPVSDLKTAHRLQVPQIFPISC
ncbi:DUF4291 domain-containing protein [Acaryochloris marina]|uniref:DUF4291 domain-containing protein n=1 Tax=Acaryochloris marina (strain MBIC 11017) TaxID=329726 RepID=B0BYR1_ACAM1|nr:DUF4291 domain-containing protein [Acaryochloris marina]ABW27077.1 conserved hypothetical protein [Acaryochloris marina MBIC11017]BDM81841.1 hypothetical protein AM10699_47060 [Acaryochloris marina MBIC10699]